MEKILVKSHGKCPKLPWMIDFHSTENGKVLNYQMKAAYADNYLDYMSSLNVKSKSAPERLTKIICDLKHLNDLENLLTSADGLLNVIKLNMEQFKNETDCEEQIRRIRQIVENYSKKIKRVYPLAIALEIDAPTSSSISEEIDEKSSDIANDIMKCLIMRSIPSNYQTPTSFVVNQKIDVIFLSNITEGVKNIKAMKKILNGEKTVSTLIFPVIQTQRNLDEIEEIIKESDGIVIDGNPLLKLLKEKFFLAQKSITAKCNVSGKPVIGVTDCFELKKSDVNDIATMVIDGIDGLTLKNPSVDLIKTVSVLCREAESAVYQKQLLANYLFSTTNEPIYSLALSAVQTSIQLNAAAIIVLTISGRCAKILSRFRPRCPIIAVTRFLRVAKQLQIYRNVLPIFYVKRFLVESSWSEDVGQRVQVGITFGKFQGFVKMGDVLVVLTGSRPGSGFTNNMRIVYASEHDTMIREDENCC